MTFGEKLQALRRRTGMSQDMLAEKLEVSRQAVSKWERDEAMPETDKLVRIAKLFDISLDELLMGKKPQPEQTQTAQPGQVYTDVKRTVKRHGYKLGYVFLTLGVLTCVLSLLLFFLWPGLAGSFFGGFDNVFSPAGQTEMIFDFGDLPDSVRGEMEAALRECGTARILLAAAAGALGKLLGRRGWFYMVAGPKAASIDGPTPNTIPPYNRCVVPGPSQPDRVAREVSLALGVPVLIVDINDLGGVILGVSHPELDRKRLARILGDNPLGQCREQTPMGIIRPC